MGDDPTRRPRQEGRTRTIGYLRVSTDKQADHGVSLEAQRAKVEAYAKLYDLELTDVLTDAGESGGSLERPELQLALARLRRGEADALLVAKLDRLTRSVRDLGTLIEEHFSKDGAALLSVSEQIDTRTASGRLVLNVLTSVAEWERSAIAERTSAALQHKAARGELVGSVPYGMRVVDPAAVPVRLEPEPREQLVIARARELRAEKLSLRAISRRLAVAGSMSRDGTPFAPQQVQRMLVPK